MRRSLTAVALAGALLAGWTMPSAAQQNGIVIQNNGVDSANSAAGADNVRISNNPGNGQSLSGGGLNNETGRAVRERDRTDRGSRNSAEAAPAEEYVAPAEGDYQAYTDGGEYVEPVPASAENAAPVDSATQQVLQLPSTGAGSASPMPLAAAAAGIAALVFGATGLRRRQTS